ncbi:MAG: FAD-dependent oxidoreductase [Ruminiclostridium sp.]|nr:FAD-dependent oxidoreductase [Ruminiclostridium sp.]
MSFVYEPLLQPLQLNSKLTIKNRYCVGPLTLPSLHGPHGEFSPDGLAYFEERAKGGFGLIYTGAFHPDVLVDPVHPLDSKQPMKAPKAFKRSAVELLERLDAYGAKMIPQVSMGYGRNAVGCYGPSEIPYYHDPSITTPALTKDQIKRKIDQMIDTAAFLKSCGFPGIEVHAMHWGYLLDQFAMTYMNHRTDEYGGELENRLRCAREIVEGVKAACGADFAVSMRLALKAYIKGYNAPSLHGEEEVGRTLEEGIEMARRLEAYGYDFLSVDFGQYDSFYYAAPPCYTQKGEIIDLAAEAKKAVNIPILCGGRMNAPDLAAQAVAEGKIDGVVLGRPSLADPAYVQKLEMGTPEDIRPCIGCNQGCIGALKIGRRAGCAVNAQAGREETFSLSAAPKAKEVLVVGGGVAGMEAARVAAIRGHKVTLCEGSGRLGGSLLPAGAHDFKEDMNLLNRWYQTQLSKLGVAVEVNTRLDADGIKARKPQAVVLALGAEPVIPAVSGIHSPKVVDCVTALNEKPALGQNVVVVGGGLVGCETAVGYAREGKTVTLVEALPKILSAGIPVPESHDQMLRDLLDEGKVTVKTSCPLEEVTNTGVVAGGETIPADSVVLAVGFRPRTSLASGLYGAGMEIYQVGDGARVGSVMTAVADGYTIGRKI